ncbi:MAG: hypothetical protein K2H64_12085 [Desulfovibrio sp.]|nr:hypothetical protein [Desulfovibrio sp.]
MDKDKLTETRFAQKLAEEDARARKLVAAGDFGEAASIYKEILADPIIDRIADISLLTKISLFASNASFTLVDAGLPEQALETAKKALTVAARTGEIYPLARYHFILSLVQYRKGDLNEAEANLLQAIRGFEAVDRKRDIGHCLNNLGRI